MADVPYWPPVQQFSVGQRVFVPKANLWPGARDVRGVVDGVVGEGTQSGYVVIRADQPIDCGPHGLRNLCSLSPTIVCAVHG